MYVAQIIKNIIKYLCARTAVGERWYSAEFDYKIQLHHTQSLDY